jgi:hypothetical protein
MSCMIIKFLEDNGFAITTNVNINPPLKTIILDLLLPHLKLFWYEGINFDPCPWNNDTQIAIKGAVIASISNDCDIKKINKCINNLENHKTINNKITYF